MTDSGFELDDEVQKAPKDNLPAWAVVLVILTFLGFAGTLVLQGLEYNYMRSSGSGAYSQAVIP